MHSLGVKKIRMNFWIGSFMLNCTEINPNATDAIEQVIRKAESLGMEIMGYAQDFPSWMKIVECMHALYNSCSYLILFWVLDILFNENLVYWSSIPN